MFSVVAMKSRNFSSCSYSADEQLCRIWEGAYLDSQPKLANGNIPYHRRHAQFINGGWPGGRTISFLFLWVQILSGLGVWTFPGVQSFLGILRNPRVPDCTIAARGLAANQSLGDEKNCIVHNLFCVCVIIILIFSSSISSSVSVSFVVLL